MSTRAEPRTPDRGIAGRQGALLLALAALVYAVYWYRDLVFLNRVQVFQDLYTFLLPRDHAARLLVRFGWPPLWNPLHGLGRPFAGDLQSGVYYPPYWVLRRLGEPLGFNLSIIFHHWIAAVGAFAWMRYRGLSRWGATLGALCLAFGGAAVSLDHHVILQRSAAWIPVALYWFERWYTERRADLFVLLTLALALILLGGQPEMFLLATVVMIGLMVDRASDGRRHAIASGLGSLAVANGLVLALCAVQVIPFAELLHQTDRSAGLAVEDVVEFSLPPAGALAFLLPHAITDRQGNFHATDAFWQRESQAPLLVSLYIGVSLMLIVPGLADASRFRRRYWSAIASAALVLSMGRYLPGFLWLLTHVPALRFARYPEKLVLIVHGVLAMGVATGLDSIIRRPTRLRRVAIGAAVAGLISGAASWSVARAIAASPVGLSHDLLTLAVSFAVFAAVAALGWRQPAACATSIILLAAIDLWRVNGDLLPTVDWDTVRSPPRSFAALRSAGDPLRIYANRPEQPDASPFPTLFLRAHNLMMDEASQFYGIANIFTPGTVNLAASERLLSLISHAPRERAAVILGAFNVAYVTSLTDLRRPGLSEVQQPADPADAYVYRVEPLAPRAFVARAVLPVARPEDAIEHVQHGDDPASRVAVVVGDMPAGLPAAMRGAVTIELYQPDRIVLRARMDTPGLIVVSDAYYGGWRAWVDDAPRPIVRANYFARGVYAAAGEHRIVLEYRPLTHTIGAIISACACALSLSVLLISGWRRMGRGAPD